VENPLTCHFLLPEGSGDGSVGDAADITSTTRPIDGKKLTLMARSFTTGA
jgi:hypothetical protein